MYKARRKQCMLTEIEMSRDYETFNKIGWTGRSSQNPQAIMNISHLDALCRKRLLSELHYIFPLLSLTD